MHNYFKCIVSLSGTCWVVVQFLLLLFFLDCCTAKGTGSHSFHGPSLSN